VVNQIVGKLTLFHWGGTSYVSMPTRAGNRAVRARGNQFKRYVTRQVHSVGLSSDTRLIQQIIEIADAQAFLGGKEVEPFRRIALIDGCTYIDSGRRGEVISVTPDRWETISDTGVPFLSLPGIRQLPEPLRAQRGSAKELEATGLGFEEAHLVLFWLIGVVAGLFVPILRIVGEHAERLNGFIRAIVDPNALLVRAAPRDVRDLRLYASNSAIVALHLRRLSAHLSDGILDIAVRMGYAKCQLYSDYEEAYYPSQSPLILSHEADLDVPRELEEASLTVSWDCGGRSHRDMEMLRQLHHPTLLGHVVQGASFALRSEEQDLATAVAQANRYFRWPDNLVRNLLDEAQFEAIHTALKPYSFVPYLAELTPWSGTATTLLGRLNDKANDEDRIADRWPDSAQTLGTTLRRLEPKLLATGLRVEHGRGPAPKRERTISLRAVG